MKKVIRMTESDLYRLVKRVLTEQPISPINKSISKFLQSKGYSQVLIDADYSLPNLPNEFNDNNFRNSVKNAVYGLRIKNPAEALLFIRDSDQSSIVSGNGGNMFITIPKNATWGMGTQFREGGTINAKGPYNDDVLMGIKF